MLWVLVCGSHLAGFIQFKSLISAANFKQLFILWFKYYQRLLLLFPVTKIEVFKTDINVHNGIIVNLLMSSILLLLHVSTIGIGLYVVQTLLLWHPIRRANFSYYEGKCGFSQRLSIFRCVTLSDQWVYIISYLEWLLWILSIIGYILQPSPDNRPSIYQVCAVAFKMIHKSNPVENVFVSVCTTTTTTTTD